ncbi:MAG: hypothetical protein KDC85_02170, partial [Saprospiraceae bacterium]|nr:hypothetical protein [Saprospiraceae bacterium]
MRYNQSSDDFSRFYVKDEYDRVIQNTYQALFLEKDTILWVLARDKELFRYDICSDRNTPPLDSFLFDIDIFPGYDKESRRLKYFFGVDGSKSPGLEIISIDDKRSVTGHELYFDGHASNSPILNIHTVFYDNDTAVWLAANSGFFRFDLQHNKLESFLLGTETPKKITPFGESRFILSDFKNGLFWFNKRNGKFTKLFAGLVDDPDTDLNVLLKQPYYDGSGTLWVENNDAGCVFAALNKPKFKSLPKANLFNGSKNYEFRNFVVDHSGRIWCGTFDDGILVLDRYGRVTRSFHPDLAGDDHLIDKEIYSLLIDKNGNIWIGTAKGLAVLPAGRSRFQAVFNEKGKAVKSVSFLCQLNNGDLMASSLRDGIFRIEKNNAKFQMKQILPPENDSDFFTYIYESRPGEVYILNGYSELIVFRYEDRKLFQNGKFSAPGLVNGFYEDINHKTLWIATEGGLVKMDKTDLKANPVVFTERNGLKSKLIRSLLSDKEGNLWMGTTNGLSKFIVNEERFINFTLADGIQSTQFDALAAMKYSDNSLWFGGNNGITIVEPDQIHFLQEPPIVQLTDIRINDLPPEGLQDEITWATNLTELKNIHRTYDDNTLSFGFVAIDYSDPT